MFLLYPRRNLSFLEALARRFQEAESAGKLRMLSKNNNKQSKEYKQE